MKRSDHFLRLALIGLGITVGIYLLMKMTGKDMQIGYYLLPWGIYLIRWAVSFIIESSKNRNAQL